MKICSDNIQRLERDPVRFDVLDLFDAVGRSRKYEIGNINDNTAFVQLVSKSLSDTNTPSMIYGRRTEAMFSYVAASLGRCLLIKKEDSGDVFARNKSILLPDYRLVLEDGRQLLVEVKNYHQKTPLAEYSMKIDYLNRLISYAKMVDGDLFFAIYWSVWSMWTLVSADDFRCDGDTATLDFSTAMKRNQMGLLGDAFIGTTPPLSLRFYSDKGKPHSVSEDRQAEFIIGAVEMRCNNSLITLENEQRIAMALMLFGNWNESSRLYYTDKHSREIDYVEFSYSPDECDGEQDFNFVDSLSTIISRQYGQLTAPNGKVERLTPDIAPGMLGFVVPESYKGEALPLWRILQQPNYD